MNNKKTELDELKLASENNQIPTAFDDGTELYNPPIFSLATTTDSDEELDDSKEGELVNKLVEQNGPYANPVSKEVLADPFWQAPEPFYGGQSFRKAESDGLNNAAKNMVVTPQDAQADIIISAEIEKYVAGEQTMDQAIANMDSQLKLMIGQAEV